MKSFLRILGAFALLTLGLLWQAPEAQAHGIELRYVGVHGGLNYDWANKVVVGPNQDIYVIGGWEGDSIVINGVTYGKAATDSAYRSFLIRFAPDGTVRWFRQFGSAYNDENNIDLAVDAAGNVYVAGALQGTQQIGGLTVTSNTPDKTDIFVAKFDANGTALWAVRAGGSDDDEAKGIAVGASGNVYVVGRFRGSFTWGTSTLTAAGGTDGFVAKLNGTNGALLWSDVTNGTGLEFCSAVTLDSQENVYVGATFSGTVTIAGHGGHTITSAGSTDAMVYSYSTTGVLRWHEDWGNVGKDEIRSLRVAQDSLLYVAVNYDSAYSIGSFALPAGRKGAYIVSFRLGSMGTTLRWVQSITSPKADDSPSIYQLAVDRMGSVYGVGLYAAAAQATRSMNPTTSRTPVNLAHAGDLDIFVVKYLPDGRQQITDRFASAGYEAAYSIAVDSSYHFFVAGFSSSGSLGFGSQTNVIPGGRDTEIFLASYDRHFLVVLPFPNTLSLPAAGGTFTVDVHTTSGWKVRGLKSYVTASVDTGFLVGKIRFTQQANTGAARLDTILINDGEGHLARYIVNQAAAVTAIEGDLNSAKVRVFPNPVSNGQFYIQWTKAEWINLRVLSPAGHVAYETRWQASESAQSVQLPSGMAQGLYLLELVGENRRHTGRLLIVE